MKNKILLTIVFLSTFLFVGTTFTNAKNIQSNVEYPDNHKKSFVDVNSFYTQIASKVYEEYPMLLTVSEKWFHLKKFLLQ